MMFCLISPKNLSLTALCLTVLAFPGCDCAEDATAPDEGDEGEQQEAAEVPHRDLTDLDDHEIVDLASFDDELIHLEVGDAEHYAACRELLEADGEPQPWPFEGYAHAGLFGCNPDGVVDFDDGRRAIAYEIPIDDHQRASDLRVVLYDADGSVSWHRRLDRSHRVERFAANYRGSFLTPIDDRLLCAGTRWQENTQVLCARLENGHIVFDDRIDFWAGIEPFGYDGALYSADADGITRRYPFTGVEMRHRSFGARGGGAGFYATDKERIFFMPSEGDPVLSGWDLETLREIWRADVADFPARGYAHASAEHGVLLLSIDEILVGIEVETGALRMAFDTGDETPAVTFLDDEIVLLVRRDDHPPMLYAVDSDDGAVQWAAEAPAGSLDVTYDGGELMTRTVRTVRTVRPATGP